MVFGTKRVWSECENGEGDWAREARTRESTLLVRRVLRVVILRKKNDIFVVHILRFQIPLNTLNSEYP